MDFLSSVLASMVAVVVIYLLYFVINKFCSRYQAYAECWWLPAWNCHRFVIRNIKKHKNLTGIRYRAWIRETQPPVSKNSVETHIDTDLANGERLLLPKDQDMPVLCFRIEEKNGRLVFVQTDKVENPRACFEITPTFEVNVEYSLKIKNLFLFKHEVSRIFTIPRNYKKGDAKIDVFKVHLMVIQHGSEEKLDFMYKTGEEISVSI